MSLTVFFEVEDLTTDIDIDLLGQILDGNSFARAMLRTWLVKFTARACATCLRHRVLVPDRRACRSAKEVGGDESN